MLYTDAPFIPYISQWIYFLFLPELPSFPSPGHSIAKLSFLYGTIKEKRKKEVCLSIKGGNVGKGYGGKYMWPCSTHGLHRAMIQACCHVTSTETGISEAELRNSHVQHGKKVTT